ncbi:MAG TPA: amino acid ABC transporter permease [Nocardioidaceae bacterium]|nr:amino acid ABC transporter permease [Nocardioidaceae bacterium]
MGGHFDFWTDNSELILRSFWLTIQLFVLSGILSLIVGAVLASFRVGPVPVLRWFATGYITIFRNTPLLMIFMFVFIAMPRLGWNAPFLAKGVFALTIYTAAFVCEVLRSGVNSVDLGQAEAGRAMGFTFVQNMRAVVLPQAFRAVVPPMASTLIALAKNTSVAAAFGLAEATFRMKGMTNDYATERTQIFFTFAIGYIIIVEVVSFLANRLERRWRVAAR